MNLGYTGKPYDSTTGLYDYGYRDYSPALARFTTVDPIRNGSNWFAYVNNDPVNWVDPWGLEAYVYVWDQDGKTYVDIQIPITYIGEGATPAVIEKFNNGIEKYWSGEFGKYSVQTIVVADPTLELMNTITVPVGNYTATSYIPGPAGTWPSERPEWTAAHEAGHLLGLHDIRNIVTGDFDLEWAKNIMGSWNGVGVVDERNIDEILRIRSPDNTIRANEITVRGHEPVNTGDGSGKKNR
jgi:RHS repeat-associated protein